MKKFRSFCLGLLLAAAFAATGAVDITPPGIIPKTCTNQFLSAVSANSSTCTSATLASAQFANQGTTATVLHGNASGNPSFSAVAIGSDVSGLGTGVATLLTGASSGTGGPAGTASPTFTGTANFGGIAATANSALTQSTNGATTWTASNTNGGTAAYAGFSATNDGSNGYLGLFALGTAWTTAGSFVQDAGVLDAGANLSGGLSVVARGGDIRFYSNSGTTLTATLTATKLNLASGVGLQLAGVDQKFPKTFTATYDPASLAANTTRTDTITVTGITTSGGAVTANPGSDFTTSCVIASVRASAADTVKVTLRNTVDAVTACDEPSSTWTFSQPQ